MKNGNNLKINVFSGISTTSRSSQRDVFKKSKIEWYDTFFPGGLYGDALIKIPHDTLSPLPLSGGDRVEFKNGLDTVYEGFVKNVTYGTGEVSVKVVGAWGYILDKEGINAKWCDRTVGSKSWVVDTSADGAELASVDFKPTADDATVKRIRITPKNTQWVTDQVFAIYYSMPEGETIGRVACDYNLTESASEPALSAKYHDPGGSPDWTDLDNALDGDTGTSSAFTLSTGDYLYIGFPDNSYTGLTFDFSAVNNNAANLTLQFYMTADAGSGGTGWYTHSATDTTGIELAGAPFGQDGSVTFIDATTPPPGDWARSTQDGVSAYWIRISSDANLDSVSIAELTQNAVQAWEMRLRDRTGAANVWSVTTNGTGTRDDDLGTARKTLHLELIAKQKQDGLKGGGIFAEISDVSIYRNASASPSRLDSISKDCISTVANLNSDTSKIGTQSTWLLLEPFITKGHETWASILTRAASFGDGDANQWYVRALASEKAAAPNGKPVLESAQYPTATTYRVSIRDLDKPPKISKDWFNIINYVTVTYTDVDGNKVTVTPDDDVTLKDTTSIAAYGERHTKEPIEVDTSSSAMAINVGKKLLAQKKDPRWKVESPISISGFIKGSDGRDVPVSKVEAGQIIQIDDFVSPLSFIITKTRYTHKSETVSITVGEPNALDVVLSQLALKIRSK